MMNPSNRPGFRAGKPVITHWIAASLLFAASLAPASSIRQIGTTELLAGSSLVVHARVAEAWTEAGSVNGTMRTRVRLQLIEVIKGTHSGATLELSFAGGRDGDIVHRIADSNIPEPGEEGVYFIEDADRTLVNPLYGWTQGHFIVDPEDGKIRTYRGDSIYGIVDATGPATLTFANDSAEGVHTTPIAGRPAPLSVSEFVAQLKAMTGE